MTSHEHRLAEAESVLRTRLESWGVEDAHSRAHEYVTDLLRQGWRPTATPVEPTPRPGTRSADPTPHIAALRAAVAEARRTGAQGTSTEEDA